MKHILYFLSLAFVMACNNNSEQTSSADENTVQDLAVEAVADEPIAEVQKELSKNDSTELNAMLETLTGIDQFFVRGSFKRLQVLLNKKESANAAKVNQILAGITFNEPDYMIVKYLPKNGYLSYEPGPVEAIIDMVYWNVSDGSQLIGIQNIACGPVCESEISFLRFQEGTYTEAEDVIPSIDSLSRMLVSEEDLNGDPLEFIFKLPIQGKDLQYCLDENCITLKWNDGSFVVQN